MTTRRVLSKICSISSLLLLFIPTAQAHAAPQVEATLAAATVSTGAPFTLSITVSWQGDADQYVIVPPEPELPEGVEKLSSSFVSSASADMQPCTTAIFSARTEKRRLHHTSLLQVKYWARGEEKESTTESGEITFKAVRFALVENQYCTYCSLSAWCCWPVRLPAWALSCSEEKRPGGKKQAAGGETSARQAGCRPAADLPPEQAQGRLCRILHRQLSTLRAWLPRRTLRLPTALPPCLKKCSSAGFGLRLKKLSACCGSLKKARDGLIAGDKKNEPDYQKYCK